MRKGKLLAEGQTNDSMATCFELLKTHGIPIIQRRNARRKLKIIPVKVEARRIATGLYLNRHPDVAEGTRFGAPVVEFFDKNGLRRLIYDFVSSHVLFYDAKRSLAGGFIEELTLKVPYQVLGWTLELMELAKRTFLVLEEAWAAQNVTLVNINIEFGKDVVSGEIVVVDVKRFMV